MDTLKKIRAWIIGPKSDFPLFLVVLVLANLVATNAFFRIDLTSRRSYSLSEASRSAIRTLEEPLIIKVFFTRNLPAPYNSVERYLEDLLIEYNGVGNKHFSHSFYDMEKNENKDLAESYGIRPAQIQELKNDEVGIRNAYMGLAIVYSDAIETMNDITGADGLEYRLTTTIARTASKANALAGLAGKVKVTLYASSSLKAFGIQDYDKLDAIVRKAFGSVNAKYRDRLEYSFADVSDPSEIDRISSTYGVQKINWAAQKGIASGSGLLGIVVENGDKSRSLPLSLIRGIFGGFALAGIDGLETRIDDNLQGLTASTAVIGYITGHGEKDLNDNRQGAATLNALTADSYELKEITLEQEEIPASMTTIIINGPRTPYSRQELYKIDQFIMRGGNLLALIDPFDEQMPQNGGYGAQASYRPIDTGLNALLEKYGAKLGRNYVMDSECYIARQQGQPEMPLYFVPIIDKKGMNQKSTVSRNLSSVLFLKAGEVTPLIGEGAKGERSSTVLVSSSPESWLMADRINLVPYAIAKPAADRLARHDLALLLEGRFESAFDKAPETDAETRTDTTAFDANTYLARSVQRGRIIVVGTSEISTPALVDEGGRQPVAIFLRNALDYLAGNEDLNPMRTKGLGLDQLDKTKPALRTVVKSVNQYGLPLLVALAGLFAWRTRAGRRKRIQEFYARSSSQKVEN